MKLLFCHSDPRVLHRLLTRAAAAQHAVVPCFQAAELVPQVAASEPHLIVIGGDKLGAPPEKLKRHLLRLGFRTPVLLLKSAWPTEQELDAAWHMLSGGPREVQRIDLDLQEYAVLAEEDFRGSSPPTAEDAARQANRFLALLSTGTKHHRRAQAYLAAAEAAQSHCESDWTLAVFGGDVSAYMWRTQLFRNVSALAHYVPGVDIECLPLPHPASGRLDYLYTALSGEAYYALSAVRAFGIGPACDEPLWEGGQLQVATGSRMSEDAARLSGWARLLGVVARANESLLDACLANDPARIAALQTTRSTRNQQQIFCRWWNFTELLTSPGQLERLTREFHAGREPEAIPAFDSFFRFAERIQRRLQAPGDAS